MATTQRGRDAGTGKFIPVSQARKHPKTAIVDTFKVGKPKKPTKKGSR